jgi:hypothetical protein
VTSVEGQGSTFWFEIELPVVDAASPRMTQSSEESASGLLSEAELATGLDRLPADWVAALRQGAEEINVEAISSTIERIRDCDAGLADALAYLAKNFEYDRILALIQRTK